MPIYVLWDLQSDKGGKDLSEPLRRFCESALTGWDRRLAGMSISASCSKKLAVLGEIVKSKGRHTLHN